MTQKILFSNEASSTLLAGITAAATAASVKAGDGALYPLPGVNEIFKFKFYNTAGAYEICHCSARSGDTFGTILRAQEGTTAQAWNAGDGVDLVVTKETMEECPQRDNDETIPGHWTHDGPVTNNSTVSHVSTDAGATVGPSHDLYRNSASPAAADEIGSCDFNGNNVTPAKTLYARIKAVISDATAAAETGYLAIQARISGALTTIMTIAAGVQIGAPTGGDKGAGTINATGVYVSGVALAPLDRQQFDANGTWTKPSNLPSTAMVFVQLWGGGGGGGGGGLPLGSYDAGGGGGGGYAEYWFLASDLNSTESVTVGAGGTASANQAGTNGGNSSFKSATYIAYGAHGGTGALSANDNAGGGLFSASVAMGVSASNPWEGGGGADYGAVLTGGKAIYGGGGGGTYGLAAGTSRIGGVGGAAGVAGTAPGGGGGGQQGNSVPGVGAHGRCVVTTFA